MGRFAARLAKDGSWSCYRGPAAKACCESRAPAKIRQIRRVGKRRLPIWEGGVSQGLEAPGLRGGGVPFFPPPPFPPPPPPPVRPPDATNALFPLFFVRIHARRRGLLH